MKKRLLSIALVLCMLVSLLPAPALADNEPVGGSCGKSVTWALKDGTLTISGTGEMAYYDGDNPGTVEKARRGDQKRRRGRRCDQGKRRNV